MSLRSWTTSSSLGVRCGAPPVRRGTPRGIAAESGKDWKTHVNGKETINASWVHGLGPLGVYVSVHTFVRGGGGARHEAQESEAERVRATKTELTNKENNMSKNKNIEKTKKQKTI